MNSSQSKLLRALVRGEAGGSWRQQVGHAGGTTLTSQVSSFSGVMVFPLSKWSSCPISADDRDGSHSPHAQHPPKPAPAQPLSPQTQRPRGDLATCFARAIVWRNSGHDIKRFNTRLNIYIILLFFLIVIPAFSRDYDSPPGPWIKCF